MPSRRRGGKTSEGPTPEALLGGLLALVPGYFLMESILGRFPHPTHWAGAAIGVAGGYGLGTLVAAYKDERPPFGPGESPPAHRFRPGPRTPPRAQAPGEHDRRAERRNRR